MGFSNRPTKWCSAMPGVWRVGIEGLVRQKCFYYILMAVLSCTIERCLAMSGVLRSMSSCAKSVFTTAS
ncbi:hypothetical protein L873DRAFT_1854607 [Choiromyces venosus 120613-1]|uniref:Uncharacterized protein n=1 Tax=Choiromyces venosus 120613-1 TaxID=1336337 RepID=A0A3N4J517_9PEZI|nr:hypothetical protein L873DRAFT_1854607 [Choiromyces venosus 120613-1]